MNFGAFLHKIGGRVAWPFKRISQEVGEEVFEKGALAMRGALAEAPILDDLLDGKPVDIVMTIQLRKRD